MLYNEAIGMNCKEFLSLKDKLTKIQHTFKLDNSVANYQLLCDVKEEIFNLMLTVMSNDAKRYYGTSKYDNPPAQNKSGIDIVLDMFLNCCENLTQPSIFAIGEEVKWNAGNDQVAYGTVWYKNKKGLYTVVWEAGYTEYDVPEKELLKI